MPVQKGKSRGAVSVSIPRSPLHLQRSLLGLFGLFGLFGLLGRDLRCSVAGAVRAAFSARQKLQLVAPAPPRPLSARGRAVALAPAPALALALALALAAQV